MTPNRLIALAAATVLVVIGIIVVSKTSGSGKSKQGSGLAASDETSSGTGSNSKSGRTTRAERPAKERPPRDSAEVVDALKQLGVNVIAPRPGQNYYELSIASMPLGEDGEELFSSPEAYLSEVVLSALELDTKVRKFGIDGKQLNLGDLRAIGWLEELEVFDLVDCPSVQSLAPLGGLARMRELEFRHCAGITDLTPLKGLKRITDVSLNDTGVTDLTPLGRNNTLRNVHISHGTPVRDLSPLASCTNLKNLTLAFVEADTNTLANLRRLQSLTLIDVPLPTANALQGLSNLRTLQLRNTGLTGLEPLARLTELRTVGIASPHITNLNPLHGLPQLQTVSLVGTSVEPIEIELLQDAHPDAKIEVSTPLPASE